MPATATNPTPAWWNTEHATAWEGVKAALQRDWEQTKADFSGGKQGTDVNQDAGDTLAQALGREPIPPNTVPNPMNAEEQAKFVARAQNRMDRNAERQAETERESIAANQPSSAPSWNRYGRWEDAEPPLRFGFAAQGHYGEDWGETTETRLSEEWRGLFPDRRWPDVRDTVRRGWDYGRE